MKSIPLNQRLDKVWLIIDKTDNGICHFVDQRDVVFTRFKKDLELQYPKDRYYFQQAWLGFELINK